MDAYQNLPNGGLERSGLEGTREKQEDYGGGVVTPTNPPDLNWIAKGMTNPGYIYCSSALHSEARDLNQVTNSAFIRTRYEWSEPSCPPRDKYRGDYERDPMYMVSHGRCSAAAASLQDKAATSNSLPGGCAGTERAQRTDKYRGDYERCATYEYPSKLSTSCDQLPRSRDHSASSVFGRDLDSVRGGKYSGDYERCPVYVKHLLKTQSVSPDSYRDCVQEGSIQ